jgi:hypothetical protein
VINVEWAVGFVVVVVVTNDDVVKLVVGDTTFAIAGRAVTLSTMPPTRKLSDPTTTDRRGARLELRVGSPRLLCPCVFNMHQLSETHSKLPPTTAQHPLNSVGRVDRTAISESDAEQRTATNHAKGVVSFTTNTLGVASSVLWAARCRTRGAQMVRTSDDVAIGE